MMDLILSNMSQWHWIVAIGVGCCAGFIKGVVGFAMPMVFIAGLSLIVPPELALAGLILPTVISNSWQAFAQGRAAAWQSVKRFRLFLITGLVCVLISAQLASVLPDILFLGSLGGLIVCFSLLQLCGLGLPVMRAGPKASIIFGSIAGLLGGVSGIWGPPIVAYLTALNTNKIEQIRVQGVIYGLGAVALVVAHIGSGILTLATAQFSALLVLPSALGMWLGVQIQTLIDQKLFRRVTLLVLLVMGLVLLRRAAFG